MIKYIGSKRKLIPKIVEIIKKENPKKVIDLFSGTSRVGNAIKKEGIFTMSNDIANYALYIGTTYVQADRGDHHDLKEKILELNNVEPKEGWFTQKYCYESQFFHPKNGAKIEAIRNEIEKSFLSEYKSDEAPWISYEPYRIAITALMEAADRVDSTCGIQMAYLKNYAPRAYKDLEIRMPDLTDGRGSATRMDAKEAAEVPMDLAYIDPPYNQHNYLGNYHIWETLTLWDNPETYGKAQKRTDVKTRKSAYNSKVKIKQEFNELISRLKSTKAVVSFNNEGFLDKDDIVEALSKKYRNIEIHTIPYDRYVGAKIGIFNKSGDKVGNVSHTKNEEYIFVAK